MLAEPTTWATESEATIFRRSRGCFSVEKTEAVKHRSEVWIESIKKFCEDEYLENVSNESECPNHEEMTRIFKIDAERTFVSEDARNELSDTLERIFAEIQDYHQGLGFIVAFLSLHMPPEDVIRTCLNLNRNYFPGYYKAQSFSYFRDARVFGKIIPKLVPSLAAQFEYIPPETFCSKWFVGLCIHVLPFDALVLFFDNVFLKGDIFVFQFGIALMRTCQESLINCKKDISKILEILRLEKKHFPDAELQKAPENGDFFTEVVELAISLEVEFLEQIDLPALREEATEEMRIEAEKRKAAEAEYSDDEIVFSDEEEE